eukprot:5781030-Amphidinium_carterae.1
MGNVTFVGNSRSSVCSALGRCMTAQLFQQYGLPWSVVSHSSEKSICDGSRKLRGFKGSIVTFGRDQEVPPPCTPKVPQ